MSDFKRGSDDLVVPFIFVPHGFPDPVEWMAQHPGWIRIPAKFLPRGSNPGQPQDDLQVDLDGALAAAFESGASQ